ncbi:hypothetical protein NM688_g3098 [Phlebia brevispora]|uniref:Uncharacterized protein n=1 Tax=Phlebia brevispora TaxID=194682 RepID=A0ACC1T6V9_9APHY|nr:hypothetical protein NM688_g3098 [Phlebia brevispora]
MSRPLLRRRPDSSFPPTFTTTFTSHIDHFTLDIMQQHKHTNRRNKQRRTSTTLFHKYAAGKDLQRQRSKKRQLQQRRQQPQDSPKKSATFRFLCAAIQRARRERWAVIAAETQRIVLGDGKYVEERRIPVVSSSFTQCHQQGPLADSLVPHVQPGPSVVRIPHDIFAQIQLSSQGTTFYPHYSEMLAMWASTPRRTVVADPPGTIIEFARSSTLTAAHRLPSPSAEGATNPSTSVGVLSHASPKKPGGSYLHGGDEQEDTLARHSSLVASLSSPAAQAFYQEHKKHWVEDGSGLHDHSMVYSPSVIVFRADADDNCDTPPEDAVGGAFITPYAINVISAVPVNAAAVRAKHLILPSEQEFFESGIRSAMKERMARVLRAFEERGDRTLVLGAFGCGSSENRAETIGAIWAELLVCGERDGEQDARFKNVFEKVVFAVPGKFYQPFKRGYEMRVLEAEVTVAALSD